MVDLILEEVRDKAGNLQAYVVVNKEHLTKKMSELWSDTDLTPLAEQAGIPLIALKEMTWIAFLKSDIAGKDLQGYKRYRDVLLKEGFDVT